MKEIFHRISVRKYEDRPVEPEKIEILLRAAMAAPSARNQQPWEFFVVTNREKLTELSKATPYCGFTAGAPAAIVTAYRKNCAAPDYAHIDMSACMENLLLAADGQGLGGMTGPITSSAEKGRRWSLTCGSWTGAQSMRRLPSAG